MQDNNKPHAIQQDFKTVLLQQRASGINQSKQSNEQPLMDLRLKPEQNPVLRHLLQQGVSL